MLLEADHHVRCLARSPRKLLTRDWANNPLLEVRPSDLTQADALALDLQGCHTAFYLVHSMTSAGAGYAQQDHHLATQFAIAAKQAGLQRIIYLGGLGETGPDLSEHLASRRDVETALGSTGVPVTVLRAAMIIGSGSASFEILRYLVERLPIMITPMWVSTPSQPIAVRDVINYLTGVLDHPETTGQIYDIGGPEVLCYRDIMRIMAEELGLKRRWIIPVPILTPRLSSYWIHFITPLSNDIGKPLAEGLKNPVVCRDDHITHIIPGQCLTVREAIRAAISQTLEHDVETNWAMAGAIPGDPDWAGGTVFRDSREVIANAPPTEVFRAVCRIGGENGWYSSNWLWVLRGWLDLLIGGPGLRRGRRHPSDLGYGEALDFWRVTDIRQNHRLALRAEMKLPGEAMLEFELEELPEGRTLLRQTARFRPKGLFGILYWYAVAPMHHFVFGGMLEGLRKEAERPKNV